MKQEQIVVVLSCLKEDISFSEMKRTWGIDRTYTKDYVLASGDIRVYEKATPLLMSYGFTVTYYGNGVYIK